MRNTFWMLVVLMVLTNCKNASHADHGHRHENGDQQNHDHGKEFTTKTGKVIIVKKTQGTSKSLVSVEISAKEFENGNHFELKDIDPIVYIEMNDLDGNGFDELYIITKSAGSGSYLNVIAYASNKDLSLSPIYFRELNNADFETGGLFEGYMGHDKFYFQDQLFVRQFPIYSEEDSNSKPTGGEREISYMLIKGEASWQLKAQKTNTPEVDIIRNCTGTYIRFNKQDYKVCNQEVLIDFENNKKVNLTFRDSYPCKIPKDTAICTMYHPFISAVTVTKVN